ncbi:MAG: GIY-YIG nuclease family protein [Patescibacteria group bacterium]
MYYTYVLLSKKDKKRYIGYTDNLQKRFHDHQQGKVTVTKNRRPLVIIYYEACLSRKKALAREKYFKTGYGRRYLNNRI